MTGAADQSLALAVGAARAAEAKKAERTIVLEVARVLAITEYFVITSAQNRRLVRTVVDAVEESAKRDFGRAPLRREGAGEQQWVLLDFGDVVVHVFTQELRDFYEIERLYRDVPRVEWQP